MSFIKYASIIYLRQDGCNILKFYFSLKFVRFVLRYKHLLRLNEKVIGS